MLAPRQWRKRGKFNLGDIMFNVNDRVTMPAHDFLSDGYILKVIPEINACIIKLDEKAPNAYAWNTDEVLMFDDDLRKVVVSL